MAITKTGEPLDGLRRAGGKPSYWMDAKESGQYEGWHTEYQMIQMHFLDGGHCTSQQAATIDRDGRSIRG